MEPLSSSSHVAASQTGQPIAGASRNRIEQLRERVSELGLEAIETLRDQLEAVRAPGRDLASRAAMAAAVDLPAAQETQVQANINLKLNPYIALTNELSRELDLLFDKAKEEGLTTSLSDLKQIEDHLAGLSKEVENHPGFSEAFKIIRGDELQTLKSMAADIRIRSEKGEIARFAKKGVGVKPFLGLIPDTIAHLKEIENKNLKARDTLLSRTFEVGGKSYVLPEQFVADAGRQRIIINDEAIAPGVSSADKETHCGGAIARLKSLGVSDETLNRVLYLANQTLGSEIYETAIKFYGGSVDLNEAIANTLIRMGDKEYRIEVENSELSSRPKVSLTITGNYTVGDREDPEVVKHTGTFTLTLPNVESARSDVVDATIKINRL